MIKGGGSIWLYLLTVNYFWVVVSFNLLPHTTESESLFEVKQFLFREKSGINVTSISLYWIHSYVSSLSMYKNVYPLCIFLFTNKTKKRKLLFMLDTLLLWEWFREQKHHECWNKNKLHKKELSEWKAKTKFIIITRSYKRNSLSKFPVNKEWVKLYRTHLFIQRK